MIVNVYLNFDNVVKFNSLISKQMGAILGILCWSYSKNILISLSHTGINDLRSQNSDV